MATNKPCSRCGSVVVSDDIRVGRSPPQHLLHSNNPPTWWESERARDAIQESQRNIVLLDAEINGARVALKSLLAAQKNLLAKRKALEDHVDAHTTTLAPLRRLPVKLLSEIFVLCLSPFPFDISPSVAPLLLQRICRRWRDIARSVPELWSSMKFSLQSKAERFEVAMAMSWLPRSGQYPLSIALGTREVDRDWRLRTHPILDLLFPHCDRWVEVSLDLADDMMKYFTVIKGKLPRLKSLITQMIYTGGVPLTTFDAFEHAPELRFFQMGGFMTKDVIKVPWQNLTKLVTRTTCASELLEILQSCPSLLDCKISYAYESDIDNEIHRESSPIRMRLAHLHSFAIEAFSFTTSFIAPLFTSFDFPVLRQMQFQLNCQSNMHCYWTLSNPLTPLLSRSGHSIRTLALHFKKVRCQPDVFEACFMAVPLLVNLELRGDAVAGLTDHILDRLTYRGPEFGKVTCLLPMLEILILRDCRQRAFADRPLAEMLRSRRRLDQMKNTSLARLQLFQVYLTIFDEPRLTAEMLIPETLEQVKIFEQEASRRIV